MRSHLALSLAPALAALAARSAAAQLPLQYTPQLLPTSSTLCSSVDAGDWNGDGWPDLAASLGLASTPLVALYLGGPSGLAAAPDVALAPGAPSRALAFADWNGDGRSDLVVLRGELGQPGWNEVVLGDGAGGTSGAAYPCNGVFPSPALLGVADFDADGKLDLAATSWFAGGVRVCVGPLTLTYGIAEDARALAVADVDVDGVPDLVTAHNGGFNGLQVVRFDSGVSATIVLVPVPGQPTGVAVGDLDGDGVPDYAVASANGAEPGAVHVLRGDGSGAAQPLSQHATSAYPNGLARLADLDGDGGLDFALSLGDLVGMSLRDVEVLLHDAASGGWGAPQPFSFGQIVGSDLDVADLNLDGRADPFLRCDGGRIGVLASVPSVPAGLAPFGGGTSGCSGAQAMLANGPCAVGNASFALTCSNAPPSAFGWLCIASAADSAGGDPFALGLLLHFDPLAPGPFTLLSIHAAPGGSATRSLPIPAHAGLAGAQLYAQSLWPWPALAPCDPSPLGWSSSAGLALVVQP
ncbi:MAG: VCBS repeat-containing protein [Planctomycetota bacterium]|nr:MAG: VCBS repeat-containing protein [Planctomycetota bacterium]